MDKIKSMLKGDSSDSTSDKSSTDTARTAAKTAKEEYNSPSSTSTSTNTSSAQPSTLSSGNTGTATESYDTTTQHLAPGVQHETVTQTQETRLQDVIDRETHEDHYHTTVQPVTDREVKPTVHTTQQAPTQYSEFEHGDAGKTEAALKAQAAQFKNTTTDGGVTTTQSTLAPIESESVHRHLHETVQPVINKETIQPNVVHTVIPQKEVHHASHVHDTTVAPSMSMDEFSKTQNVEGSEDSLRRGT